MSTRRSAAKGLHRFAGILAVAAVSSLSGALAAQSPATGGFVEPAASPPVRAPMTASQIQSLLPARGPFVFPAPYLTLGVRLTNATDCGGSDCVNYVGYSYWRNTNAHVG